MKTATHNDLSVSFKIINDFISYIFNSFSTQEVSMLKWIDQFKDNLFFCDIGSYIKINSIYEKKKHNSYKVISYNPSYFNLNLIYKSVFSFYKNLNYIFVRGLS